MSKELTSKELTKIANKLFYHQESPDQERDQLPFPGLPELVAECGSKEKFYELLKELMPTAVEANHHIYREGMDEPIPLTQPIIGKGEGGGFAVSTWIPSGSLQATHDKLADEGQLFSGVILRGLPAGSKISFKDDGLLTALVVDIKNTSGEKK